MPRYATYATPRADLGVAVFEYMMEQRDYVGTRALPLTPVPRKSGTYSKIQRESLLRARNVERGPGGTYNRDTFDAEDQAYTCKNYGIETLLDDSDRENYRLDFDAEMVAVENGMHIVLREQEKRIAKALDMDGSTPATWTGATLYTDNSGTPWTTTSTDVITQILAAKEKVRTLTGLEPDTLLINQTNFNRLKNIDDLVGRVGNVTIATDDAMAASMASLLGVRQILVGRAFKNTANEGAAFSGSAIWSNLYAMVMVTAPSGQMSPAPTVGRTFLWESMSPEIVDIVQYRAEDRDSDVFKIRQYTHELVVDASYAHLMKVATS